MTEHDLLEGFRNNDNRIIAKFYKENFPICTSFVRKNSGTIEQAKDIYHDSLIAFKEKIMDDTYEFTCTLKTYFYSINRYKWLQQLDKRKRGGLSLVVDENSNQEYIIIQEDDREINREKEKKYELIRKAIDQLGEDCKKLLMDYYHGKIKLKDIAEEMEYTSDYAKQKKKRCMNSLKKEVIKLFNKEL